MPLPMPAIERCIAPGHVRAISASFLQPTEEDPIRQVFILGDLNGAYESFGWEVVKC